MQYNDFNTTIPSICLSDFYQTTLDTGMDTGASDRCVRRREARPSTLSSQVEHAIPEGYVNRAFYSKRASARWGGE